MPWSHWTECKFSANGEIDKSRLREAPDRPGIYAIATKVGYGYSTKYIGRSKSIRERLNRHFSGDGNRVIKQLLLDKREGGLSTRPLNALYFAYLETSEPKLLEAAYIDANELERPVLNLIRARLPEGLREGEIFKSELEVESSSCFIATAAYESSSHPDLDTFRAFREQILFQHFLGCFLVEVYYWIGPHLAIVVSSHPRLKKFIRSNLERLAEWLRSQQIVQL